MMFGVFEPLNGAAVTSTSVIANFTFENWSATCFSASVSRKPAPITML